jgi:hypothetical protein
LCRTSQLLWQTLSHIRDTQVPDRADIWIAIFHFHTFLKWGVEDGLYWQCKGRWWVLLLCEIISDALVNSILHVPCPLLWCTKHYTFACWYRGCRAALGWMNGQVTTYQSPIFNGLIQIAFLLLSPWFTSASPSKRHHCGFSSELDL